jgi:hypothetical protein
VDIEIFTICDAATISCGKLNILGSFDRLNSKRFPFQHPDCAVAIKVRFENSESGDHVMEVRFIDLDGQKIVPSQELKIRVTPSEGQRHLHMHISQFEGLPFQKPGEYYVDLVVDKEVRSRIPLFVVPAPTRPK